MYAGFSDIGANIYIYTFIWRDRHQNAPKTLVGTNYLINCYLLYFLFNIWVKSVRHLFPNIEPRIKRLFDIWRQADLANINVNKHK